MVSKYQYLHWSTGAFILTTLAMAVFSPSLLQAEIRFQEITAAAGITYRGPTWGASWGDFDGDGWPDLWVGNHTKFTSLYINQKNGVFVDKAALLLPKYIGDTHGVQWVDFDNDGDEDVYEVSGQSTPIDPLTINRLFVNESGRFQDRAPELGIAYPEARSRTPLWFDWDNDGRLDVLITVRIRTISDGPYALFRQTAYGFENVSSLSGLNPSDYNRFAQLADLTGDGVADILVQGQTTASQRIFQGGTIPFLDRTDQLGVPRLTELNDSAIYDFNGDLRPDIFRVRSENSFNPLDGSKSDAALVTPSQFQLLLSLPKNIQKQGVKLKTNGVITITMTTPLSLAQIYIGSGGKHPTKQSFVLSPEDSSVWGIACANEGACLGYDVEQQEWQIILTAPKKYLAALIKSTQPIIEWVPVNFEPYQATYLDVLLINSAYGFEDHTVTAGLNQPTACVGVTAGDYDNDMDVDLYLVCTGNAANLPNILYENQGDGTFVTVPDAGGAAGSIFGRGDNAVTADYDNDGFLDLFVVNGHCCPPFEVEGPHQLFRNLGNSNHWLEIDLEGVQSNRDGISARLIATAGGKAQLREQTGGMHCYAQNHQRIHFGLGANLKVSKLQIHWPNGIVQELTNIPADQLLHIMEPVTSDGLGQPSYQAGVDEGVYLWKDSAAGPYHVRVSGNQAAHYSIRLVAAEFLGSVTPVGLEGSDVLQQQPRSLSLDVTVAGEKGLDFTLPAGTKALWSVIKDGVANPRQVHVGAKGTALTPAGWVVASANLAAIPDHQATGVWGLSVGKGAAANQVSARWRSDGIKPGHRYRFELLADGRLVKVTPFNLEGNDRLTRDMSRGTVQVVSQAYYWFSDGVDVTLAQPGLVGIAYTQDDLLQPHRVNSNGTRLGQPNAYWLP